MCVYHYILQARNESSQLSILHERAGSSIHHWSCKDGSKGRLETLTSGELVPLNNIHTHCHTQHYTMMTLFINNRLSVKFQPNHILLLSNTCSQACYNYTLGMFFLLPWGRRRSMQTFCMVVRSMCMYKYALIEVLEQLLPYKEGVK